MFSSSVISPPHVILYRLKRLKNCMCCCVGKQNSAHSLAEAHTIENHASKGQPPLLEQVREIDKVSHPAHVTLPPNT